MSLDVARLIVGNFVGTDGPHERMTIMSERGIHRLKAGFVASKKIADGMYPDGGGLYLQVKNNGRSWLLRYMLASRQRYMGLGPAADISLSEARDLAADAVRRSQRGLTQ